MSHTVIHPTDDMIEAFAPPYGPTAQAVVDAAFGGAG